MIPGDFCLPTDNNLPNSLLIAAESTSERACLIVLDRHIDELSAQRKAFSSAAHELSHHLLALDGLDEVNNAGMASALDTLDLVVDLFGDVRSANWPSSFTRDALSPQMIVIPKYRGDSVPRLPSWATRDVAGMLPAPVLDDSGAAVNPTPAKSQLTFRLSEATGSQLADVRAALMRLIDALIAMAHLCLLKIWMVRRERSHILARALARIIGRLPDIRAFVLVMIAACRRYGHRSEPDDHASLLTRCHLVSMGSCPPI
jgi:hypothetical protein